MIHNSNENRRITRSQKIDNPKPAKIPKILPEPRRSARLVPKPVAPAEPTEEPPVEEPQNEEPVEDTGFCLTGIQFTDIKNPSVQLGSFGENEDCDKEWPYSKELLEKMVKLYLALMQDHHSHWVIGSVVKTRGQHFATGRDTENCRVLIYRPGTLPFPITQKTQPKPFGMRADWFFFVVEFYLGYYGGRDPDTTISWFEMDTDPGADSRDKLTNIRKRLIHNCGMIGWPDTFYQFSNVNNFRKVHCCNADHIDIVANQELAVQGRKFLRRFAEEDYATIIEKEFDNCMRFNVVHRIPYHLIPAPNKKEREKEDQKLFKEDKYFDRQMARRKLKLAFQAIALPYRMQNKRFHNAPDSKSIDHLPYLKIRFYCDQ